jgi:hypothetical protein
MKLYQNLTLFGALISLVACNGGSSGSDDSTKTYSQSLAGGAEVSISLPSNISQTTTTTINVNNVPAGTQYTFDFPSPTPVSSTNQKANLSLQADNNLTVSTNPSPCIIDATHSSCSLVFDTTGAANGTYQITPHYAATGNNY